VALPLVTAARADWSWMATRDEGTQLVSRGVAGPDATAVAWNQSRNYRYLPQDRPPEVWREAGVLAFAG
jgi:hypothetical protein